MICKQKSLCGLFLSAAVALSGCGRISQPGNDNGNPIPPRPHDNAELTTASMGDEFITGEERFHQPVRFSDISSDADPRLQRLIIQLQRTTLGRALYDYMVDEKMSLQWENDDDKRIGVYYHDKDLIALDARHPDDGLLSILVHEIRHAWQYRKLGITEWPLSPQDRWRVSRLVEADSCAFSVHFVAVHKNETGHLLDSSHNFNRLLTEAYMYTPADQRNYITGALEPCFERVKMSYDDLHMDIVKTYFNRSAAAYADASGSPSTRKLRNIFDSTFNTPGTQEKAALFSAFMTLTLDPKTGMISDMKNISPEDFLAWLDRQAPVNRPADRAEIDRMETKFLKMRERIISNMSQP